MLGQLTGQQQAHGSLDLARGDGRLLVVLGQARRLVAAMRSTETSLTNEFMMDMALDEMPVSGCTCLSTL